MNLSQFFEEVKAGLKAEINKSSKDRIVNHTNELIEEFKTKYKIQSIELQYDDFATSQDDKYKDYITTDNYLLAKGFAPGDRILQNKIIYKTKKITGNKALIDFIAQHTPRDRESLASANYDQLSNELSFSIVIYGPTIDAEQAKKQREQAKISLKNSIDYTNSQITPQQNALDALVVLQVNLIKKRYLDDDDLNDSLNSK